jgi:hypothetical protein
MLEVTGQMGQQRAGLLGAKARDHPVALLHPKPAQQLDPAPRVHVDGSLRQLHCPQSA